MSKIRNAYDRIQLDDADKNRIFEKLESAKAPASSGAPKRFWLNAGKLAACAAALALVIGGSLFAVTKFNTPQPELDGSSTSDLGADFVDCTGLLDFEAVRDMISDSSVINIDAKTGFEVYKGVWETASGMTASVDWYGPTFFDNTVNWIASLFETDEGTFIAGMKGGVRYLTAISKADPNSFYYFDDFNISPPPDGIYLAVKYTRVSDSTTYDGNALNAFSSLDLFQQYNNEIDYGNIGDVRYTDELGELWLREVGSLIAPYYPITVASQTENSVTLSSQMAMYTQVQAENVRFLRDVTYTVSKTESGWVQTIDSVSEPYMADSGDLMSSLEVTFDRAALVYSWFSGTNRIPFASEERSDQVTDGDHFYIPVGFNGEYMTKAELTDIVSGYFSDELTNEIINTKADPVNPEIQVYEEFDGRLCWLGGYVGQTAYGDYTYDLTFGRVSDTKYIIHAKIKAMLIMSYYNGTADYTVELIDGKWKFTDYVFPYDAAVTDADAPEKAENAVEFALRLNGKTYVFNDFEKYYSAEFTSGGRVQTRVDGSEFPTNNYECNFAPVGSEIYYNAAEDYVVVCLAEGDNKIYAIGFPSEPTADTYISAQLLNELGMTYSQLTDLHGASGGSDNCRTFETGYGLYVWDYTKQTNPGEVYDAGGVIKIFALKPDELFIGITYPMSFDELEQTYGVQFDSISDEVGMSDCCWSSIIYGNVEIVFSTFEPRTIDSDSGCNIRLLQFEEETAEDAAVADFQVGAVLPSDACAEDFDFVNTGSAPYSTETFVPAAEGSTVSAVQSGTVTLAEYNYGYGNCVIVDHGNGLSTYYSHLSEMLVSPGDEVVPGDAVGTAGNTGLTDFYGFGYTFRRTA